MTVAALFASDYEGLHTVIHHLIGRWTQPCVATFGIYLTRNRRAGIYPVYFQVVLVAVQHHHHQIAAFAVEIHAGNVCAGQIQIHGLGAPGVEIVGVNAYCRIRISRQRIFVAVGTGIGIGQGILLAERFVGVELIDRHLRFVETDVGQRIVVGAPAHGREHAELLLVSPVRNAVYYLVQFAVLGYGIVSSVVQVGDKDIVVAHIGHHASVMADRGAALGSLIRHALQRAAHRVEHIVLRGERVAVDLGLVVPDHHLAAAGRDAEPVDPVDFQISLLRVEREDCTGFFPGLIAIAVDAASVFRESGIADSVRQGSGSHHSSRLVEGQIAVILGCKRSAGDGY